MKKINTSYYKWYIVHGMVTDNVYSFLISDLTRSAMDGGHSPCHCSSGLLSVLHDAVQEYLVHSLCTQLSFLDAPSVDWETAGLGDGPSTGSVASGADSSSELDSRLDRSGDRAEALPDL